MKHIGVCGSVFFLLTVSGYADQIVIASDAGKVVRFAAAELQWHLKEITGETPAIVPDDAARSGYEYRVGASKRTRLQADDLAPQVWTINATDEAVEFVGRDNPEKGEGLPGLYVDQGSLYAVYEFLEKDCGVVWADSTEYGTVFTKHGVMHPAAGFRRGRPFIRYRGGAPLDHDRYEPELWKRGSEGLKRYNEFAYPGLSEKEIQARKRIFLRRHRLGGDLACANHSFYWCYERFLQKDHPNFEEYHPEYFAKGYVGTPPQMCYTDPGFIARTIKDIREYFDNGIGYTKRYRNIGAVGYNWGRNNYCLEPMDNGSFCKCERCVKEYEPERSAEQSEQSTHWFKFVNTVAREIKKSHPGKHITTLAYFTHKGLPTGIKLEDNVVVYFCITANRTCYSKLLDTELEQMRAWRRAYPKQPLAMWLYNTFPLEIANNGGFNCFPGFFAEEAAAQYRLFKELDVSSGIFHCGFNGEIDNYMQCEWMIDPTRRTEAMLDEYFAGCGAAAKPLKEFYRTVERRYCDKSLYPEGAVHQTVQLAWGALGDEATMTKLEKLIGEAEAAAATDFEKARVKCFRLAVWDYMKEGYDAYTVRTKTPVPHWTAERIAAAGGDTAKVDWNSLAAVPVTYYDRGAATESSFKGGTVRLANDGAYLYLELTEKCATAKLVNAPAIACFDTWEFLFERQRAQPFRYYLSAPDGRIVGSSWGEVNWRQNVPAEESGDKAYGAKCTTDLSRPDVWTARYAFPLARMLDKPVAPGETIYFNIVRVAGGEVANTGKRFDILVLNPYTTVHTSDRAGEILLK